MSKTMKNSNPEICDPETVIQLIKELDELLATPNYEEAEELHQKIGFLSPSDFFKKYK